MFCFIYIKVIFLNITLISILLKINKPEIQPNFIHSWLISFRSSTKSRQWNLFFNILSCWMFLEPWLKFQHTDYPMVTKTFLKIKIAFRASLKNYFLKNIYPLPTSCLKQDQVSLARCPSSNSMQESTLSYLMIFALRNRKYLTPARCW